MMNALDGSAAALCVIAFVVALVRRMNGADISPWVLVSLPIIAVLALGRIAQRAKAKRRG